jgi:hypothetical protein
MNVHVVNVTVPPRMYITPPCNERRNNQEHLNRLHIAVPSSSFGCEYAMDPRGRRAKSLLPIVLLAERIARRRRTKLRLRCTPDPHSPRAPEAPKADPKKLHAQAPPNLRTGPSLLTQAATEKGLQSLARLAASPPVRAAASCTIGRWRSYFLHTPNQAPHQCLSSRTPLTVNGRMRHLPINDSVNGRPTVGSVRFRLRVR